MIRLSMKLGLLVLLGLSNWFLTSRFAGKKALGQMVPGQIVPGFIKTKVPLNQNPAMPAGAVPVVSVANFTFDSLAVTPGPHGVTVNATVELMDKRPDKSYMWGVVIRDESFDNVLRTVNYEQQAFAPPPNGKTMQPTFKDAFQLPAGEYYVEVIFYDLKPRLEFGLFNAADGPKPELSRYERVTVME